MLKFLVSVVICSLIVAGSLPAGAYARSAPQVTVHCAAGWLTGHGDAALRGTVTLEREQPYVFTELRRPDGTDYDMSVIVRPSLNRAVTDVRAVHVIERFQNQGRMDITPLVVPFPDGTWRLRFTYPRPGSELSTLRMWLDLAGGGVVEVYGNIPVNGITFTERTDLPPPQFQAARARVGTLTWSGPTMPGPMPASAPIPNLPAFTGSPFFHVPPAPVPPAAFAAISRPVPAPAPRPAPVVRQPAPIVRPDPVVRPLPPAVRPVRQPDPPPPPAPPVVRPVRQPDPPPPPQRQAAGRPSIMDTGMSFRLGLPTISGIRDSYRAGGLSGVLGYLFSPGSNTIPRGRELAQTHAPVVGATFTWTQAESTRYLTVSQPVPAPRPAPAPAPRLAPAPVLAPRPAVTAPRPAAPVSRPAPAPAPRRGR